MIKSFVSAVLMKAVFSFLPHINNISVLFTSQGLNPLVLTSSWGCSSARRTESVVVPR